MLARLKVGGGALCYTGLLGEFGLRRNSGDRHRATPKLQSCRCERNRLEEPNNLLKTIQQEPNKMGPAAVQRPDNREAD